MSQRSQAVVSLLLDYPLDIIMSLFNVAHPATSRTWQHGISLSRFTNTTIAMEKKTTRIPPVTITVRKQDTSFLFLTHVHISV
jgi:hypothetical protein